MLSRISSSLRFGRAFVRGTRSFSSKAIVTTPRSTQSVRIGLGVGLGLGLGLGLTLGNAQCAPTPFTGVPGTYQERSFIAIKPDGVQRGLIGEIISRFEKKGYKLVALKMVSPTKEMAERHYADLSTKPFFAGLTDFFSSGPIVCMVWEGKDVIRTGRKMLGATNPLDSNPGTIRGDYCTVTGRNVIHGSDGPESAAHEIAMWFTEQEINNWNPSINAWTLE